MAKSYKDLDINKESLDFFIKVCQLSLKLPKHEIYELGSQLRRSSDSINSNIVEGHGRNNYKNDFLIFLYIAISSNYETINHLMKLEILNPEFQKDFSKLIVDYDSLGVKIYKFIEYVKAYWKT